MTTLPVGGQGFRPYDVVVGRGLLARAGERIATLARGRTVIVSDETVVAIHGHTLSASLEAAGVRAVTVTVPAGWAAMSFAQLGPLVAPRVGIGLERNDVAGALRGGGGGGPPGRARAPYLRAVD